MHTSNLLRQLQDTVSSAFDRVSAYDELAAERRRRRRERPRVSFAVPPHAGLAASVVAIHAEIYSSAVQVFNIVNSLETSLSWPEEAKVYLSAFTAHRSHRRLGTSHSEEAQSAMQLMLKLLAHPFKCTKTEFMRRMGGHLQQLLPRDLKPTECSICTSTVLRFALPCCSQKICVDCICHHHWENTKCLLARYSKCPMCQSQTDIQGVLSSMRIAAK